LIQLKEDSLQRKKRLSQSDKFKQLAREVEADEDEAAFAERLRRIAKAPPPAKPQNGESEACANRLRWSQYSVCVLRTADRDNESSPGSAES
jgi:hypothetical protein